MNACAKNNRHFGPYHLFSARPPGQRTTLGHEIARGPLSAPKSSGSTDAQVFIEGGMIRKLWGVERDAYRDHLLRLDSESRHNRFGAAITDDVIRTYAATAHGSDVIVHGFFAPYVQDLGALQGRDDGPDD